MIKEVPNPTLECIGCIFKDALQCLSMPCFANKDNPIKYIEVNEDIDENNMNKKAKLKPEYCLYPKDLEILRGDKYVRPDELT